MDVSAPAGSRRRRDVAADLHRREVRRHRLGCVAQVRSAAAPALDVVAVGDDVVAVGTVSSIAVGRLVVRAVVAREPGRCPVRLAGDDDAVGQLLPAGLAEVRRPAGRACRRTGWRRRARSPAGSAVPR